jgi:hypothetical protein
VVLPPIPTSLLAEQLCHAVLDYLVEDEVITDGVSVQNFLLITRCIFHDGTEVAVRLVNGRKVGMI